MTPEQKHLTDQELVSAIDGGSQKAPEHLAACAACSSRERELREAAADFSRLYQGSFNRLVPPAAKSRASLETRLFFAAAGQKNDPDVWRVDKDWFYAAAALLILGTVIIGLQGKLPWLTGRAKSQPVAVASPLRKLTPGAVVNVDRQQLCQSAAPNNRRVPESVRRQVFAEYGIQGAEAGAYEVDYLITPALGGADDIHNLWPQSYNATVWNARVKDHLETQLHRMVCEGQLELVAAQQDISSDWIAAYKKYFHTNMPPSE